MKFLFRDKRISGLLAVVPANEASFLDEMRNFDFPAHRSLKLKEVMGYDKHRLVQGETCVSDLAVFGLQHLIDRRLLDRDDIDALILVTQSPDHLMPPTSSIIQVTRASLGARRNGCRVYFQSIEAQRQSTMQVRTIAACQLAKNTKKLTFFGKMAAFWAKT